MFPRFRPALPSHARHAKPSVAVAEVGMGRRGTWTGLVAACLTLAACVPAGESAAILDGAVRVGLPAGYCLDPAAGRQEADSAVVVMGRCRQDSAVAPAVISVAVGPDGSGQVLAAPQSYLAGYFMSQTGRAAMAADGRAESVSVQTAKAVGPAIVLRLTDRRTGSYWRGVEEIAGRAVTISVSTGDVAAGEAVLTAALDAMRRANP
jgi:hypothetical protein